MNKTKDWMLSQVGVYTHERLRSELNQLAQMFNCWSPTIRCARDHGGVISVETTFKVVSYSRRDGDSGVPERWNQFALAVREWARMNQVAVTNLNVSRERSWRAEIAHDATRRMEQRIPIAPPDEYALVIVLQLQALL